MIQKPCLLWINDDESDGSVMQFISTLLSIAERFGFFTNLSTLIYAILMIWLKFPPSRNNCQPDCTHTVLVSCVF